MAPVVRLHRLVWSGRLFEDESWSCSLHLGSPVEVADIASSYAPALEAWFARADSKVSASAHLDEIKLNVIDPATGRYMFPVSNTHVVTATVVGAAPPAPGQIAAAVTTRTALSRGRGHAGRFYPPSGETSNVVDATGRISAADAQAMAFSAATLLTAINAVNEGMTAVVFSKVAQSIEVITHVGVGRVWDTIRSRRTSLAEDPRTSPVS